MLDQDNKAGRVSEYSARIPRGMDAGNDNAVLVTGLVKEYCSRAGSVTALRGIDLAAKEGEFLAVVGKSGAGKTTLVNMITGIDKPTAGVVLVDGVQVQTLSEDQRAAWRRRAVGVVFQFFQLVPSLTVHQNVMLPMDFANRYSLREQRSRAMDLLDQMGIVAHAHKLPSAVSGGQQQRVAIARALANDPPIVVADEPTGSLDSETSRAVLQVFEGLVDRGRTVIIVTHDKEIAERADRVVTLQDGCVVNERWRSGQGQSRPPSAAGGEQRRC
jgi:putative ABC transport system ATP-binding protein